MARAKHTYAVRLAVEGGGKVKAELVDVGQAGDRSLKVIAHPPGDSGCRCWREGSGEEVCDGL